MLILYEVLNEKYFEKKTLTINNQLIVSWCGEGTSVFASCINALIRD
ncbi:hypothetical protein BPO_0923 [Bergeyella porcorum]|uniref:Transposase n=1 Tax=Bergeyella porcorum TaxID=1735111 RepID=A0AAU0F0J5_9FLAO